MQNFNPKFKSDLKERCFKLSLHVISLTEDFSDKRGGKIIANQLIRSATSIGANLVEARAASSRLEFKKFYEIALKSANETKYWLFLTRGVKLTDESKIAALLTETSEIANMLASGVIKLKNLKKSFDF